MSVHSQIRQGRLRLNMSEYEFATALGVTRAAVQQWERESGTAPRRSLQKKVAALLGMSVPEMMGYPEHTLSTAEPLAEATHKVSEPIRKWHSPNPPSALSDRALDLALAYDSITDPKRKREVYVKCINLLDPTLSDDNTQNLKQASGGGA